MRTGAGMGAFFAAAKAIQLSTERFGMGWWAGELIQVGVVVVAFLLVVRKVAQLEARVNELEGRLDAIRTYVRDGMRLVKENVLEWVS